MVYLGSASRVGELAICKVMVHKANEDCIISIDKLGVVLSILLVMEVEMSKPEFSRGKSKTFQPFNRAFSALCNALQLHSGCAELKRD